MGMLQLPQQQSLTLFLFKYSPSVLGSPFPLFQNILTVGPYGSGWFY